MKSRTKTHFDNILNTFSGEDGGIAFIKFRNFVEQLDKKENDESAESIIEIMVRFSRMIQLAQEENIFN